ncbi:flagellar protein FlgN [Neobacillus sp. PS3-12]|uniref:flagellar protein FlgN n=1 Tax=Neobacillus sp. PS3-12 TaxID=3070677 RepID=UPI0027DF9C99|nr:flagellar protein FlgN [Neobacillus sp. PS3-12]WML54754.1 flagellar protein FlgN [Neobacillus sp. PS3-12]
MSAEKLISTMEKLLKLHKSLYEISQKKTEIVKIGDIEALNQILKDEQAHLTAINLLENERQKVTSSLVPRTEKPTIEDCLAVADESSHNKLDRLRSELKNTISEIQQRNELNQQMLFQSLQFVNLSLNLIAPQPEDYNYGQQVGQAATPGLLNLKA